MISHLRRPFNQNFTSEKYSNFLAALDRRCGTPIKFRVAETPCFFPKSLLNQMAEDGRLLVGRDEELIEPDFVVFDGGVGVDHLHLARAEGFHLPGGLSGSWCFLRPSPYFFNQQAD